MLCKPHLFAVALVLLLISCAFGAREAVNAPVRLTDDAQHHLYAIALIKISGNPTSLRDDYPPPGFHVRQSNHGRIWSASGEFNLEGTPERAPGHVLRAPAGKDLLVGFGSGAYAVYSSTSKLIADVPPVHTEFKDATVVMWRWKDTKTLVGEMHISAPVPLPQYPETDLLPDETVYFLFRPYAAPDKVYRLITPTPAAGNVIRLDGVTQDGRLQLSEVIPEQYFGGPAKQVLGLFDLEKR